KRSRVDALSHFLSENRHPLFRKMLWWQKGYPAVVPRIGARAKSGDRRPVNDAAPPRAWPPKPAQAVTTPGPDVSRSAKMRWRSDRDQNGLRRHRAQEHEQQQERRRLAACRRHPQTQGDVKDEAWQEDEQQRQDCEQSGEKDEPQVAPGVAGGVVGVCARRIDG